MSLLRFTCSPCTLSIRGRSIRKKMVYQSIHALHPYFVISISLVVIGCWKSHWRSIRFWNAFDTWMTFSFAFRLAANSITGDILELFRAAHHGLEFTFEMPIDNQLQFLDLSLMKFDGNMCWCYHTRSQKEFFLTTRHTLEVACYYVCMPFASSYKILLSLSRRKPLQPSLPVKEKRVPRLFSSLCVRKSVEENCE